MELLLRIHIQNGKLSFYRYGWSTLVASNPNYIIDRDFQVTISEDGTKLNFFTFSKAIVANIENGLLMTLIGFPHQKKHLFNEYVSNNPKINGVLNISLTKCSNPKNYVSFVDDDFQAFLTKHSIGQVVYSDPNHDYTDLTGLSKSSFKSDGEIKFNWNNSSLSVTDATWFMASYKFESLLNVYKDNILFTQRNPAKIPDLPVL